MPTSNATPPQPGSAGLDRLAALLAEVEDVPPGERAALVVVASQDEWLCAELRTAGKARWWPLFARLEAVCSYRPACVREWRTALLRVDHAPDEDGPQPDPQTLEMLEVAMKGGAWVPTCTPPNLDTILEHDPRYAGRIEWDEFTYRILVDGEVLQDTTETEIVVEIGRAYGLHYDEARLHRSLAAVAHRHTIHPVREYLEGLRWDGVPRLDRWLATCCGVSPDERLAGPAGRRFMISAVARVMQPGCKVDTVLILVGKQGAKKSTAFKTLFGASWFSDTSIDVRKTDAMQALDGNWCVEWAELDSLRRSEATAVKAFLTSATDKYRPPYARNFVDRPRQCVFVGTTNERQFLSDPTGSRRFWTLPVVEEIDADVLASRRDQLWAEAVAAFGAGEQWWLDEDEDEARAEDAERFAHSDAWGEVLEAWLELRREVTCKEVLAEAIGLKVHEITRGAEMRVASILQRLGWERKKLTDSNGRRRWAYVKP